MAYHCLVVSLLQVELDLVYGCTISRLCYHSLYLPLLYVTFLADFFQIFGIALGFNLLFQYDDLITRIGFATVVPNLLPYGIFHLGKKMARTVNACMAAFALL